MPNEEVEFKTYATNILPKEFQDQYENMTPWQRMDLALKQLTEVVFYLSYIDIDGNEYLTITKLPAMGGLRSMAIASLPNSSRVADSLRALAKTIRNCESITYDNVDFRTLEGNFRNLDSLLKK